MENNRQNNDEIDVFELFRYIGRGFEKLGNAFLRFFNFLIRNSIIIGILIVVGLVAGYFLDKNLPEKRKTVITVVSNFESSNYLYKSIDEIESLIDNENEFFLQKIGLNEADAAHISLEIKPIEKVLEVTPEEKSFFDILEDSELMSDDEKKEMLTRAYTYHEISFFHTQGIDGRKILEKIVEYIRENPFYADLAKETNRQLQNRIESNEFVLDQIDTLLRNYTNLIAAGGEYGKNLIYSENSLNLAGLLKTRMELQEETKDLIIQRVENTTFLKVVDLGYPQELTEAGIFNKKMILLPVVLLGLFFLWNILKILSYKGRKMKNEI